MRSILFTAILLFALPGGAPAGALSYPAPVCSPVVDQEDSVDYIHADGFAALSSPGDPALPFVDIHLLLPPDADPSSVTATLSGAQTVTLPGEYSVPPAPPAVTYLDGRPVHDWGAGKLIEDGRNTRVYRTDAFYPAQSAQLIDIGNMRAYRIARVRYYPCRYNPVSRQLQITAGGDITLSFTTLSSLAAAPDQAPDTLFSGRIARLAANYAEAGPWYRPTGTSISSASQASGGYLVLTTSAIADGSGKLNAFLTHKAQRGFTVHLATESQWGGGIGETAANNIRAYLKANYTGKAIRYVLLIGNPHPSSGDVPMKMLWPRYSSSTYREAPSDYFYADLTGNWDRDGDGYFGEGDHDFGPGGIDIYPEVLVGRIPFYGSLSDLDSVLQKTIDYETGAIGGEWFKNVLLSMKPSDSNTPGYHLGEAIKTAAAEPAGFGVTRVYDQTYSLNPPPDYTPCSYDKVLSAWQQRAGFHFWWTHGNEATAADIMTTSRTQYLDNQYPSFVFQCSCLNAYPETSTNLAYSLLKRGAVATNAATRVSWYYPGQTTYTNTGSNAGMAYTYALKLIRDKLPCADAHFEMMTQVPRDIWMNHCVFNIYGDPSLAYLPAPVVAHEPLPDTDVTTAPYVAEAQVTSNGALQTGSPAIKWNTNASMSFNTAPMALISGTTYRGNIPAQPYGATVYYYVQAIDSLGRAGANPAGAPASLHSFRVRIDLQPPLISHAPPPDTGSTTGPYTVRAVVTDDTGLQSVTLRYHTNSGTETSLDMLPMGDAVYEALIPGPTNAGDTISYYIAAVDSSASRNTARAPAAPDQHSFRIVPRARVAVFNCSQVPSYFKGGNSNTHAKVAEVLNGDPAERFQVTVLTALTAASLADQDSLVLPDNAVLPADLGAVSAWFGPGKRIVTLDSATSYAGYSGFLWPQSAGSNGHGTYWDTNSAVGDQEIVLQDPITAGYMLGQVIDSRGYEAQFFTSMLPADAVVVSRSRTRLDRAYAVYRDVPNRGRFIALGPFISIADSHFSMIREALAPAAERSLRITAPVGGSVFDAGEPIAVAFRAFGGWDSADRVRLEYATGLDFEWRAVPGAESLAPDALSFTWHTSGLPGSSGYRIRASHIGGIAWDQSDPPFTIVPIIGIPEAKCLPDGCLVKLSGKVVTSDASGLSYVQEPDRSAGIRVLAAQEMVPGAQATLVGHMTTLAGERALAVESAQLAGIASLPAPLCVRTSDLGGGAFGGQQATMQHSPHTEAPAAAFGLNNVGLLVRVSGVVTSVGPDHFYLNDGAWCSDGSGAVGVRVICGSLGPPAVGEWVSVTGVSSTYFDRGLLWRALVLPAADQMQVVEGDSGQ